MASPARHGTIISWPLLLLLLCLLDHPSSLSYKGSLRYRLHEAQHIQTSPLQLHWKVALNMILCKPLLTYHSVRMANQRTRRSMRNLQYMLNLHCKENRVSLTMDVVILSKVFSIA